MTPSPADWVHLGSVLNEVGVWHWLRTWPPTEEMYTGEWKLGVAWNGRIAASTGPIGVRDEIEHLIDEVEHLVGITFPTRMRPRCAASPAFLSSTYRPIATRPGEGVAPLFSGTSTAGSKIRLAPWRARLSGAAHSEV